MGKVKLECFCSLGMADRAWPTSGPGLSQASEPVEETKPKGKTKAKTSPTGGRPKGPQKDDICNRCHQRGHWARECQQVWFHGLWACGLIFPGFGACGQVALLCLVLEFSG